MNKKLATRFPTYSNRNVALYYFLTIFLNGWFILPNWVFYFSRTISIPAIGIIEGISKTIGIAFEVPSGIIADAFGRRDTLIIANFLKIIGCLVLIYAPFFLGLLAGNILLFIGFSLISGTKELFLYDSLAEMEQEEHYDELLSKVTGVSFLTTAITITIGGVLYAVMPELTLWAWLFFSVLAIHVLLHMDEPETQKENQSSIQFRQTVQTSIRSIFQKPLATFALPALFVSLLISSQTDFFQQTTSAYFSYNGSTFAYLMVGVSLAAFLISYFLSQYQRKRSVEKSTEQLGLPVILSLYLFGFVIVLLTNNWLFGGITFLCIHIAEDIAKPFVSRLVSKNTSPGYHATTLSTVTLLSQIPYILLVIFFGFAFEFGNIRYIYLALATCIFLYLICKKLLQKKSLTTQ